MNFTEKKQAYQKMQDPDRLCCDHELLTKKAPNSLILKIGVVDQAKAQREILWALLDVATVEEIESYRNPAPKKSEWIEKLVSLITASVPETIEGLKLADDTVCELLDQLEADGIDLTDDQKNNVSAYKGYLSAAMIDLRKKEVEQKLIGLDLESATQPELAKIARSLNLAPNPDFKAATLRPQLDDYRLNLLKVSEGSGEEMIPVEAHLEIVNELEEENENLQEQLEDSEAEKELLEEQLEEEKKSEATPDQV